MEQYKQEFIEFMVDSQVLKFGDFTLKSGRKSPFLMYCLGLPIKEFRSVSPRRWQSASCMEKKSGIVPTGKKSRTMGIPGSCWAANLRTEIR